MFNRRLLIHNGFARRNGRSRFWPEQQRADDNQREKRDNQRAQREPEIGHVQSLPCFAPNSSETFSISILPKFGDGRMNFRLF
ncbi:hypothetical protein SDC9_165123 [bioreactor metagenome]|uniref:Uncharacterized protein n=1 Tax=bioreactor metagenome TaxID=1076179 RepID=A0A645FTI5_9ZZZZ